MSNGNLGKELMMEKLNLKGRMEMNGKENRFSLGNR